LVLPFTKTSAQLADLAGGRADGSWLVRLRRYLSPELLILDDFAMREYTVLQPDDLYELVSRPYHLQHLARKDVIPAR
jgi:DNA replication protein DnaC